MWKLAIVSLLATPAVALACDNNNAMPTMSKKDTPGNETATAIYGPGIGGDALANTVLGGRENTKQVYNRFRAEQSASLVSFTFYYIGDSDGYSGGSSGKWKAEIMADDGTCLHQPTGEALASQTVEPRKDNIVDYKIEFESPAALTAGNLYHLVYTNIDSSPEENFFSPNYWYYFETSTGLSDGRDQPKFAKPDWVHGYYDGLADSWVENKGYSPILDLSYDNGEHQGMSYGESSADKDGDVGRIHGSEMVRETFTVSGGDKTVQAIGIRVLREKDTGEDDLSISVEDDSGKVINNLSIPSTFFMEGAAWDPSEKDEPTRAGANAKWTEMPYVEPITLMSGKTYSVRLSTGDGSTTYWAWPNRKMTAQYNYDKVTAFRDGHAEKTSDGKSWSSFGRAENENDLQFYFR